MVAEKQGEEGGGVFCGVLLEGLWGTKKDAFSKQLPTVITSRSLAAYLQSRVPKFAARNNKNLNPSVVPSFPEGGDIYFGDGIAIEPPKFPAWPPLKPVSPMSAGPDLGPILDPISPNGANLSVKKSILPKCLIRKFRRLTFHGQSERGTAKAAPTFLDRLRGQRRPDSFETKSGFAVSGATVQAVWAPADVYRGQHGEPGWWRVGMGENSVLEQPTPVLIQFADGLFAAVTALPGFIASIICDEKGVAALVYREVYSPETLAAATESAISELERGGWRADAATNFAVELRQLKHADPVLGVISAYLYDSINDVDSVRRMAYYYIENKQPIPYDIAMLARIEAEWRDGLLWVNVPAVEERTPRTADEQNFSWTHEATPSAAGRVGGLSAWVRAGRALQEEYRGGGAGLGSPGMPALLPHLRQARFTTFDTAGAHTLASMFKLVSASGG